MAKQQKVKTKTPEGVLGFSHLSAPDTEGQYATGKYSIQLLVDKDDPAMEAFEAKLKAFAKEQFGTAKDVKLPLQDGDRKAKKLEDKDKDGSGFKGKTIISAKSKFPAGLVDKKNRAEIALGDAPRSGDVVKAAVVFGTYEQGGQDGINLFLNSVLLIERNAGGGNPANDFDDEDFDDEDGAASSDNDNGADDDPDF